MCLVILANLLGRLKSYIIKTRHSMMDPVAPRAVPVGTTRFKILDDTARRMPDLRCQSRNLMVKCGLM